MNELKNIWLVAGYNAFARGGIHTLKVDVLASAVGKSRSSFYHLFGDMEGFEDALFDYHLLQTRKFVSELESTVNAFQELTQLVPRYKDWLFTYYQSYIHRNDHQRCLVLFEKVTSMVEPRVGDLWIKLLKIDDLPPQKTHELYHMVREAFFAELNYDDFSEAFLIRTVEKLNNSLSFLLATVRARP